MAHRRRRVASIDYDGTAGWHSIELPMDAVLKSLDLRLHFTDTISGGTTSGTVVDDAVFHVINRIGLELNGRVTIKDYSAVMAQHLAGIYKGTWPEHTPPTSGDAGAYDCACTVPVEIGLLRSLRFGETVLDLIRFRSLTLRVEFAAATVMFNSTHDRAHAISNGKLDVYFEEEIGVRRNADRPIGGRVLAESEQVKVFSAAATLEEYQLSTGGLLKRVAILAENTTTGARVNTSPSDLALLYRGQTRPYDGSFLDVRANMLTDFGLATVPTGLGLIELDKLRNWSGLCDVRGTKSIKLVWTVEATRTIYVVNGRILRTTR